MNRNINMNKPKNLWFALLACLYSFTQVAVALDLAGRSEADLKRDKTSLPQEIIAFSGVKEGDTVLDLLGGGGYYSELLSQVVGKNGQVTLQNNNAYLPYVGKELDKRLANRRLSNVTKLLSEADDLKLGSEQYDEVFLVLGLHDMFFKDKGWDVSLESVMPQVIRSMKNGARMLIVDHTATEGSGSSDSKRLHRLDKALAIKSLQKYGFKLVQQSDVLVNSKDDHSLSVFDPKIRRHTDRFVLLFEKIE